MIEPDYTVKQVAHLFGVTTTVVYRMINQGLLDAYRVGTGKQKPAIRITAQSVNEYRRRNRVRSQEDTSVEDSGDDVKSAA